MKGAKCYERYPYWAILLSNLVSIAIYLAGAFIIYQFGLVWAALYLLYVLYLEIRLIKWHCVDCYYYGRTCAFGKGKLSSLFFRKGNPDNFAKKQATWKDIIPDFMVTVIPMAAGAIILIGSFDWIILSAVILLFILGFIGNGLIRSRVACKYCKQRELGCPAEKLFDRKKK